MDDPFKTPDEFRKWLRSFRPKQIVGTRCSGSDGPAARYLKHLGYLEAVVCVKDQKPLGYPETVVLEHEFQKTSTWEDASSWLNHFVSLIDVNYRNERREYRVQARTALRVLSKVT